MNRRVLCYILHRGAICIQQSIHFPISNPPLQPGPCRKAGGERECSNVGRWVSSLSCPTGMSLRPPCDSKLGIPSAQEDHRAGFYEHYRKEAEEYDREFMKKHDGDLNITLIFVSFTFRFGGR